MVATCFFVGFRIDRALLPWYNEAKNEREDEETWHVRLRIFAPLPSTATA